MRQRRHRGAAEVDDAPLGQGVCGLALLSSEPRTQTTNLQTNLQTHSSPLAATLHAWVTLRRRETIADLHSLTRCNTGQIIA